MASKPPSLVHSAEEADRIAKQKYQYYTDYKQCNVQAINEGFITTLCTAVVTLGLQWPFRKRFKRPGYIILAPIFLSTTLGAMMTFRKARQCSERWKELEYTYGALKPTDSNTTNSNSLTVAQEENDRK